MEVQDKACDLSRDIEKRSHTPRYIGRFAPSPSGNLHFGSLVTALASYLVARQNKGKWLLRIDDIDKPRCKPDVDKAIMKTLQAHGLYWDDDVLYQSQRLDLYDDVLQGLLKQNQVYFCRCTRKEIKSKGEFYTGVCADKGLTGSDLAIRFRNPGTSILLPDPLLEQYEIPYDLLNEDFVLRRRDGIHGYHLVSVVDDIAQGVTHVIRGADLILPSTCQLLLYKVLDASVPEFSHVPVAISQPGKKLSKQNHSPGLNNEEASDNLISALEYLGVRTPVDLQFESPARILAWATTNWSWSEVGYKLEIQVPKKWC